MQENMDLSAMERMEYLNLELSETEKQIHKCKRSIEYLEKGHKRQRIRLIVSFLCIFIFYGLMNLFDSSNIITAVALIKYRYLSEAAFLFFLLIRFPYNLLRYLGECGMDGFAKLFLGNPAHSYVNMKQKSIVELAGLEAKRDAIYEQIHQSGKME